MYTTKLYHECEMPSPETPVNVLVLNCSLKHQNEISNTGELAELALSFMKEFGKIELEEIRMSDKNIPQVLNTVKAMR